MRMKQIVDRVTQIVEEDINLRKTYHGKPLSEEDLSKAVRTLILFYSDSIEELEKLGIILNNLSHLDRLERKHFAKLKETMDNTERSYRDTLRTLFSTELYKHKTSCGR